MNWNKFYNFLSCYLLLAGIKEFMTVNEKFKLDEEDLGNQRQVEFNDLFEIFKLV